MKLATRLSPHTRASRRRVEALADKDHALEQADRANFRFCAAGARLGLGKPPGASRGGAICAALICAALAACTAGTPFEDGPSAAVKPAVAQEVDTTPTGSIARAPETPLDKVLAPGDHAAVLTALGASLDPQSPGSPVTWTAAGGQGRGEARPTAMAQPIGDDVCRAFALDGTGLSGKFNAVGLACRNKRGDWRVRELTVVKNA